MKLKIFRKSSFPHHEHTHHPQKGEFILALFITFTLAASLFSEQVISFPHYITPLLIMLFIGIKVMHIVKKGGTLLEDYASLGVITLFLLLYIILQSKINTLLIIAFISILLYSAGFMLWFKSTFNSTKIRHFIASYVITAIMIITLFTGAYMSSSIEFIENGQKTSLVFEKALYFSTVTFTTVGYGDITPLGINRLLAALEAFIGVVINVALMGYVLATRFKEY